MFADRHVITMDEEASKVISVYKGKFNSSCIGSLAVLRNNLWTSSFIKGFQVVEKWTNKKWKIYYYLKRGFNYYPTIFIVITLLVLPFIERK